MTTITLLTIAQLRTLNTHSAAAAPPPPQEAPSAAFIIAAWLLELAKKMAVRGGTDSLDC